MEEITITNQIIKSQNDKKLIAFYDKLKEADLAYYAQIHAKGESYENGIKKKSLIGVQMYDYSNGTGNRNVMVQFNLAPEEIQFILSRLTAGFQEFEWHSDKIFGNPDAQGYSTAQKMSVSRSVYDQNKQIRNNPWTIIIQNGRGIRVANKNGGYYMQKNSYIKDKAVFMYLTDAEMFMLLKRVDSYINLWETMTAYKLIDTGRETYQRNAQSKQNQNNLSQYNNGRYYQQQNLGYSQNNQYQQQGQVYQQGYSGQGYQSIPAQHGQQTMNPGANNAFSQDSYQ